ncbi:inactive glucose-6-phosphate 1-dehydrogenase 4, chloroplastic isoform X3 [Malania oleifera]|uniref:inactive glucose-6-phosphate 1-dehydrogenase 4, chloroplastic isoform X3 n=1 Tax=Malania oleifera TaxID=397392 RepID=UPI0025AE44F3|nr:inactive glucose-6-phosphate 1-dehydrogenase 4, chloroplastic isoform X3 [Malania oleifera]
MISFEHVLCKRTPALVSCPEEYQACKTLRSGRCLCPFHLFRHPFPNSPPGDPFRIAPVAGKSQPPAGFHHIVPYGASANFCHGFCGLKLWILENLKHKMPKRKCGQVNKLKSLQSEDKDRLTQHLETSVSNEGGAPERSSVSNFHPTDSTRMAATMKSTAALQQTLASSFSIQGGKPPLLCIAVIGATGELARMKIFPALFALYYSGFLPENVGIFGYSRKNLTDEDLRSIIASTLTCRVEHETFYLNGEFDNREGMSKLNALMEHIEGGSKANRIFYLSVPQEALLDVASCLADNAQTQRGWNRIIIEKPFGFDLVSSRQLTQSLLSKFEEKQIYRIDHLLGRNLIENLTVLRFSNLVFEPLWSRTYVRNVQIILSEELGMRTKGRYFDGYGITRDIVHSHILQTIALLAMEPPISLDGEDIRNEKVKVLRSIRKVELSDVVLGQYKSMAEDKVDVNLSNLTPTFCAAALYIDNARWDGVPFLIRAGMGLIKHRVEIRIQFHHVPGNLYRESISHDVNLATNELILREMPEEAILVRVNNKIPGLGLQLDASELNLLYKDKYNVEVPDSYEHLLLDVIDGDSHLFMRSDEVAAAWNILTPVLKEIDKKNIAPELYELGGRGPVGAYYLWAKHGVPWAED